MDLILNHMPEMDESVIKVMVVGDSGCGKTTFIQSFYDRHNPGGVSFTDIATMYSCRFEVNNQQRRAAIIEVSSDPAYSLDQKLLLFLLADIFVIMYAIDDPKSLQEVHENLIPDTLYIISQNTLPAVFVGNKRDLRGDQEVIERLARENQSPVTTEQGLELSSIISGLATSVECSSLNSIQVDQVFDTIFNLKLMDS